MILTILVLIGAIIMFLLQSTVFPHIALAGVVPDLMLILVVSVAYTRGRTAGVLTGFFCGILADFCFGDYIGVTAAIYLSIGYAAGIANKIYDEEDFTLPVVFMGVGELVYNIIYYIINFMFRGKMNLPYYFFRFMIPRVIYTVLISILLYKIFNFISIKLNEHSVTKRSRERQQTNAGTGDMT